MGEMTSGTSGEVSVAVDRDTHVGVVEIHRPPHNYFDTSLIRELASIWESLDEDPDCRAIVLCSEGRNFCAGRNFEGERAEGDDPESLYTEAARLLATGTPWVAAVQGAAIGGGLGLAMAADFRVASTRASFSANFARLGFHHGFGLTVTLPSAVGHQRATELLYTGMRIDAEQAAAIGLADRVVDKTSLREEATAFAGSIAAAAPLAVRAIRATMRADLVERFRAATAAEAAQQGPLRETADFREGVAAARERRTPRFTYS
ncbi:MAG: Enoyl-CoA hydratase [Pseudonocardia sp.]|nr:Enoyl-CoA hydratase [Pseudonocardia sp.]